MSTTRDPTPTPERVEIDTADRRGRLRRVWDTLQDTVTQTAETVTRSATLKTAGGAVEDVDPPEDIDEFVDLYYEVGPIRKNINEFVSDVVEPGLRVEAEDDATEDYFMGGDAAPEGAPANGFLSECMVFDESRQPMRKGLEVSVRDRWVRGTVMVELLKADPDDDESLITGFKFIRPETVSARTYENTTQLIAPDDTEAADLTTRRDEAAAYVQFDEESVLGRRLNSDLFTNPETSIPLSQNDVLKLTLDQDIGGPDPEDGVFGESILSAVNDDADEYRDIKRSLAKAVQGKAWGIWTLQMTPEVVEADGRSIEIIEWDDDAISDMESEVEDLGPGDALTADAPIALGRHDGDVPDLEWTLAHYVRDIVDPLPAPFYKHSQAEEINQFVTEDQQEDYQERIRAERRYHAEQWQSAFRTVAERHPDLEAEGLEVRIEPEEDDSPILSLDAETIEKIAAFADALDTLSGQLNPVDVFGEDVIRDLVVMLPESEELGAGEETLGLDGHGAGEGAGSGDGEGEGEDGDHGHGADGEAAEQIQAQFDRLVDGATGEATD